MGNLPIDVVRYIVYRFAERDVTAVLDLLDTPCLSTPRLLRAVVYLADGSVGMLQHFIKQCEEDFKEVVVQAEFVLGIADEPLPLRDMSQPFDSNANLGAAFFERHLQPPKRSRGRVSPTETELTELPRSFEPSVIPAKVQRPNPPMGLADRRRVAEAKSMKNQGAGGSPAEGRFHALLQGARFCLGAVLYIVAEKQPSPEYVSCRRIDRGVTASIRLPAAFVYEQLAETIDIGVPEGASGP